MRHALLHLIPIVLLFTVIIDTIHKGWATPTEAASVGVFAALEWMGWGGVANTSTSLVSTYLRFDPHWRDHGAMRAGLTALLAERDWFTARLPSGRRLWRVPTAYGGQMAPQPGEAAAMTG